MQDKKDMEMEEWIIDPDKLTEHEDHFTTEHSFVINYQYSGCK